MEILESFFSLKVLSISLVLDIVMGEGLEQMYREVASSSSSRAEDEDELGESSSLSGDSSDDDEQLKDHEAKDSASDPHGHLHELSSLVSQLPIK